jgi:hypothetical protein
VISDELAQREFIHFMQDLGQFLAVGELRRKALPVDFTQRDHECVAVLSGDLAVPVAVTIVQTWLFHRVYSLECAILVLALILVGREA